MEKCLNKVTRWLLTLRLVRARRRLSELIRLAFSQAGNLVVLSDSLALELGRCGHPWAVLCPSRHVPKSVRRRRKRLRQIRPRGSGLATGSFNVCPRGELSCGDTRNRGPTILGDRAKHPTANSSTMKGPKGLVGQCSERRRRSARSLPKGRQTTTNGLG